MILAVLLPVFSNNADKISSVHELPNITNRPPEAQRQQKKIGRNNVSAY
ncbi:hypothetical protein ADICYQ_4442 [Cyclobacterium qasimii M12-11B]|uniref:Uncharacterized protein n=1 Tax=Cyclobacterium qasimii M12-11B TaxID=641524 RepID=S7V8C9_9BACT|nr:hypothetical protein ADICYQ_4442 [Cyclobacterium qasimii M12-11B]